MGKISSVQQLELIELIYSAGVDPAGWTRVVTRLGELHPHAAVAFQLVDLTQKQPAICLAENWEDGAVQAYVGHYASVSPWLAAHHSAVIGKPYVAADTCPVSTYVNSEFFADFITPYHVMCGAVAVKLFDDARRMATLSMNYSERSDEQVLEPMERLLGDLAPHLHRAIEMNRQFSQLQARSRSIEGLLNSIASPALLVGADSTVRYMNQQAAQAVGRRRGLSLTKTGRIALERRDETTRLHRLVNRTASLDALACDSNRGSLAFTVLGEPAPNFIFASPLTAASDSSLCCFDSTVREVLLTVQYRRGEASTPHEHLLQAFGFTAAESDVVLALAKGATLSGYAEQVERSVHTVRVHLKRAMSKADCHSQAEIVALMWRMVLQAS